MTYRDNMKNLANNIKGKTLKENRSSPLSKNEYERIADMAEVRVKQEMEERILQKYIKYDYVGLFGRQKNHRYEIYVLITFILSPNNDEKLYYYNQMMKIGGYDHEREHIVIQTKYWEDVYKILECIKNRLNSTGFDSVKIREAVSIYADHEEPTQNFNVDKIVAGIKQTPYHSSETMYAFRELVVSIFCSPDGHIS